MAGETGKFQERGSNVGKALTGRQDLNRQKRNGRPSRQIIEVPLAIQSILPVLNSNQS